MSAPAESTGRSVPSSDSIGVLRLAVENVSYSGYQDDYVGLDSDVLPFSPDGYPLPTLNGDYDYPGYHLGLGAFFQLGQGQAKKVAIPYVMGTVPDYVGVQLGSDTVTYVPVSQE